MSQEMLGYDEVVVVRFIFKGWESVYFGGEH